MRVYPLGAGGNLILCHSCLARENNYRHVRGVQTGEPANWPEVDWSKAKVYGRDVVSAEDAENMAVEAEDKAERRKQ